MPNVFVPREIRDGETRVAAVAETVQRLIRDGFSVTVQSGAGALSMISDEAFEKAGAQLEADSARAYAAADIVLKPRPRWSSVLGAAPRSRVSVTPRFSLILPRGSAGRLFSKMADKSCEFLFPS